MKKFLIFAAFMPAVAFGAADDCATMRTVPDGVQSLQDVINLGLCRNPQTAAAYASLRSSHFNKNAGYANYLPSVSVGMSAGTNYSHKDWSDWNYAVCQSSIVLRPTLYIPDVTRSFSVADFNKLSVCTKTVCAVL